VSTEQWLLATQQGTRAPRLISWSLVPIETDHCPNVLCRDILCIRQVSACGAPQSTELAMRATRDPDAVSASAALRRDRFPASSYR
jgi:hypothetical protein